MMTSIAPTAPATSAITTCAPCGDSALSTTASITGIVTFALAILATVRFYVVAYRDSPNEIEKWAISMDDSVRELNRLRENFKAAQSKYERGKDRGSANPVGEDQARPLLEGLRSALFEAEKQLLELDKFFSKIVSYYRQADWRGKGRYVTLQRELRERIGEKDKAMDRVRIAVDRYVSTS